MSAKISGAVWELDLPREEKYVLLCLADHADHEGHNVYPSIARIAWKTDYSERRVQQLMRRLEERRILLRIQAGAGRGNTTLYRIDLDAAVFKEPYKKGAKISPFLVGKGEIPQARKGEAGHGKGEIPQPKRCNPVHPNLEPSEESKSENQSLNPAPCGRCGGSGQRKSLCTPGKIVICECRTEQVTAG